MMGATAKSEQFFHRSGNESTKGSRKGFGLLGGGDNPVSVLTSEELRDSLVAKMKGLNAELAEVKKGKDKRRLLELGRQISAVGLAINAIRPKKRSPSSTVHHFVDICRETMTKVQFDTIMGEASARARAASLDKEAGQP